MSWLINNVGITVRFAGRNYVLDRTNQRPWEIPSESLITG